MSFCQSIEYRPSAGHYRPVDIFLQRQIVEKKYHNSDMQTLSERLKSARKAKGLSQVELAKKAGVAQSTISGIETRGQEATTYIPQLAAALGVNALWLAEEKGPREADAPVVAAPQPAAKMVLNADLLWMCVRAVDAHLAGAHKEAPEEVRIRLSAVLYSGYHQKPDVTIDEMKQWLDQWSEIFAREDRG